MGNPIHCNVNVYLLWVTARLAEWFLYACESTYNEEKALVGLLRDCENFADGSFAALISSVSCWVTDWVHVLMIPTVTESSPGPGGVMTVELIPIKMSAAASWSFTSSYLALEPWLTCGWWQLQSAPIPMNCGWSVGIERLTAVQDATKPKQSLKLHCFGHGSTIHILFIFLFKIRTLTIGIHTHTYITCN